MRALRGLSRVSILGLAQALEAPGTDWPPGVVQLDRLGLGVPSGAVRADLSAFAEAGASARGAALALRLVAEERVDLQHALDRLQLVWSGPEDPVSRTRETSVVVRELFQRAERSVLVATYAIAQGEQVFGPLARRMDEVPTLAVRVFVNVPRPFPDARSDAAILVEYGRRFREVWPGARLPAVFHDPRALSTAGGTRASLHAKCVVVDGRWAFVTSANFTEAAQERNVEAGLVVEDESVARALVGQFDGLVEAGALQAVPLPF